MSPDPPGLRTKRPRLDRVKETMFYNLHVVDWLNGFAVLRLHDKSIITCCKVDNVIGMFTDFMTGGGTMTHTSLPGLLDGEPA